MAPKEEKVDVEPQEAARVQGADINATTSAIKLAETENVNIALIAGTGKSGRIVKRDVEGFLNAVPA